MARRRHVQPELEGAEAMLRPAPKGRVQPPQKEHAVYVALSVIVHPDGTWRVHAMHKAPSDHHVQTTRLDGGDGAPHQVSWALEVLREYAGDVLTWLR